MYNPLMERVVTQDPGLRTTQYQWCRCGELRRFVDGNGSITEWERDERSRVRKELHADGTFETYAYDLSGRLATEVDAMNRTVTYAYTVDDRVAKKDYSEPGTPDVTYSYDTHFPRLTSRVDGAGTTTFTYHPYGAATHGAGQVARVNGPLPDDTLKYTYDELGRMKKLEIVDDSTQSTSSYTEEYTFDPRSRVTTVANNVGSTTYAFVGQSTRPSTVAYANGMETQYEYFGPTGDQLLKQIKHLTAGPTPSVISQYDYTYGTDRSIATWRVEQGSVAKTWTFGYDASRQLTSAALHDTTPTLLESHTYGYDKAGAWRTAWRDHNDRRNCRKACSVSAEGQRRVGACGSAREGGMLRRRVRNLAQAVWSSHWCAHTRCARPSLPRETGASAGCFAGAVSIATVEVSPVEPPLVERLAARAFACKSSR